MLTFLILIQLKTAWTGALIDIAIGKTIGIIVGGKYHKANLIVSKCRILLYKQTIYLGQTTKGEY